MKSLLYLCGGVALIAAVTACSDVTVPPFPEPDDDDDDGRDPDQPAFTWTGGHVMPPVGLSFIV